MIDFSTKLSKQLKGKLPGQVAQKQMMPHAGSPIDRFSIEVKKGAKEGAVLLLLYKKEADIYLVLTQRHTYEGAHSGQISFPGGKVEEKDASVEATALRETEEEIGVPASTINVLGRLTDLFIIASNFNVRPVVAYLDHAPDFILDPREVDHIIEVKLSDLMDDSIIGSKEMIFKEKYKIQAPYFNFNDNHVWGATAMMLAEFKEILKVIG
ncbi:MAG: CoA pyrophosphatase [Cyclobacteriaceae bacterium]|nr:CoA pyrophosphatase [Cyclobacteriaceae bacterium]